MDWSIENTSLVILGAGFSTAATEGAMPLMSNFFDGLRRTDHASLFDFVSAVANDVSIANVESVLLSLDQIRTSPESVLAGWADKWKVQLPNLQRELSRYTLARLKDGLAVSDDNWAAALLAACDLGTTVISMNYDNIAERVLSCRVGIVHGRTGTNCPHCKMRFLLEKACSCAGREKIIPNDWQGAVIKPHGSIAWRRCVNPDCCSYECLVADERCRPFEPCGCPYCERECAPVMVMPNMSKNLNDLPEIGTMWQAARGAVSQAESILLFGFSMPTSDELLMQMMRAAIRDSNRLTRVAAIDLDPDAVLSRFMQCVPPTHSVSTTPLKVYAGRAPEWLVSSA